MGSQLRKHFYRNKNTGRAGGLWAFCGLRCGCGGGAGSVRVLAYLKARFRCLVKCGGVVLSKQAVRVYPSKG